MFGLFSKNTNNLQREYESLTDSIMAIATRFYKTLNLPDTNDDEYEVKRAHARKYLQESLEARRNQISLMNKGLQVSKVVDAIPVSIILGMDRFLKLEGMDDVTFETEYIKMVDDARKAEDALYSAVVLAEKEENPQVVQGLYVAFILSLEKLKFLIRHAPKQSQDAVTMWQELNKSLRIITFNYRSKYRKDFNDIQIPQLPELINMYKSQLSSPSVSSPSSSNTSRRSSIVDSIPQKTTAQSAPPRPNPFAELSQQWVKYLENRSNVPASTQNPIADFSQQWVKYLENQANQVDRSGVQSDNNGVQQTVQQALPSLRGQRKLSEPDQPIYNLKNLFQLPPRRQSIDYDTQSIFPTDEYITVDYEPDLWTPRDSTVSRPQSASTSRRTSVTSAASRRESVMDIAQQEVEYIENQLIQASPRHSIVLIDETPVIAASVVDDLVESNVLQPGDVKTVEIAEVAEEPVLVVQMTPKAAEKVEKTFSNRISNWMLMLVLAFFLFNAIKSSADTEGNVRDMRPTPTPAFNKTTTVWQSKTSSTTMTSTQGSSTRSQPTATPTPVWNPYNNLKLKTQKQDFGESSFNVLINQYQYAEKDENKTIADILKRYRNLQARGLLTPFLVTKFIHSHPNVCMLSELVKFEITNDRLKVHNFDKTKFAKSMQNCAEKGAELIIAPMTLQSSDSAHANYLIYNTKTSTLERFDPNGSVRYLTEEDNNIDEYRIRSIRNFLSKFANSINLKFVDHSAIPIQQFEVEHLSGGGLCTMWSDWYMRILAINPHLPRDKLQNLMFKHLQKDPKAAVKHMYSTVKEFESLFNVDAIKDFDRLHWAVYGNTIPWSSIKSGSALNDKVSLMTMAQLSQVRNLTLMNELVTDVVYIDKMIEDVMKNQDWWKMIGNYVGKDLSNIPTKHIPG